jgi:sigma-B regulation protein RsbU (phosphoserine phosphatase)
VAGETWLGRELLAALGLLTVLVVAELATPAPVTLSPLFGLPPLLACAFLPAGVTAGVGGASLLLTVLVSGLDDALAEPQTWVRVANVALVAAAAVAIAAVRVRREQRLARMTAIAEVAQRAILPILPTTTGRVTVANRYVSAARDAVVGGDLYDCSLVGHRIRFMVGDVRGKGIAAVEQAARVIRAFRQAAAVYPSIDDVAGDMNSYLTPFFDDEEFVTALLVDVTEPDTVVLTSCGHAPAILVPRVGPPRYVEARTGLPLGLGLGRGGYSTVTLPWSPGDRLLMYTDGIAEARGEDGEFLQLLEAAAALRDGTPEEALEVLLARLREHVRSGRLDDDLALVLLESAPVRSDVSAPFGVPRAEPLPNGGSVVTSHDASPRLSRGG